MLCNLVNFILVNRELEVGWGWQWREDVGKKEGRKRKERVRETKKGVKLSNPSGRGNECRVVVGDRLPLERIRRCPAMSCQLSLCAGMEVLARTRSGSKAGRRRERPQRSTCCPFIGAFAHAPYMQFLPYVLPA